MQIDMRCIGMFHNVVKSLLSNSEQGNADFEVQRVFSFFYKLSATNYSMFRKS